ncbi:hypothetical protein F4805DRAFT_71760 [Annulohypoxylon moriforme]|nr:hypothetical protein F4805DRAFT_71760 [Annulohypoxylon moriforme]
MFTFEMDAAGLAITVLKLVAFSIDFVTDAKQVYQNGATDRNSDLAIISKSIQNATRDLESQIGKLNERGQKKMDPVELDIHTLAIRAAAIGNELTFRLNELNADSKLKRKVLAIIIRGVWDYKDIERIEKQLNGIRDEMQLRILIDIRNSVKGSQSDEYQRIVSGLEQTANILAESKKDSGVVKEILNQVNESIKSLQQPVNRPLSYGEPSSEAATGLMWPRAKDYRASKKAEDTILSLLWYPSIQDREESIYAPYASTLNWIYSTPYVNSEVCKWDSFIDFLEGESSMYWITGKPGSGKSTLMKFIQEQPRTIQILRKWSGNRPLLSASFYFFYKGSPEQKTELGLFRSLLHCILSKRNELIPLVFRRRFTAALNGKWNASITLPEAKSAIRNLFLQNPHLYFFLTIDGLDEFDPEVALTHVTSLITLTKVIGSFPNVKLVVSSRQMPEFEQGFMGCPHLRIHHLTKDDIHHYATARLESHQHMQSLLLRDPISSRRLIESITLMSSGVFLWVRVVTESLLQGLTNRDSIHDLQERLNGLPSDLQDLYKVIISKINPIYRRHTCELLRLVYFGTLKKRLSALDLYFTEQENYDSNLTQSSPVDEDDLRDYANDFELRLAGRCLGLIETVDQAELSCSIYNRLELLELRYLHKTVKEFLEEDTIKEQFLVANCRPDFDPHRRLLSGAILRLKIGVQSSLPTLRSSSISSIMQRAIYAEYYTKRGNSDLLQAFDSIMTAQATIREPYPFVRGGSSIHGKPHWSEDFELLHSTVSEPYVAEIKRIGFLPKDTHPSFLDFAVRCGLVSYIEEQIKFRGREILIKKGFPLLGHALAYMRSASSKTRLNMVKLLLNNGCSPRQLFENVSVWGWYWRVFLYESYKGNSLQETPEVEYPEGSLNLIKAMVQAGAGPDIKIPWLFAERNMGFSRKEVSTPLAVLNRIRNDLLNDQSIQQNYSMELVGEVKSLIRLLNDCGNVEEEIEGLIEDQDHPHEEITSLLKKLRMLYLKTTKKQKRNLNQVKAHYQSAKAGVHSSENT